MVALMLLGMSWYAGRASAKDQTITGYCIERTENQAEYGNCLQNEAFRRSESFRKTGVNSGCGPAMCVYRLTEKDKKWVADDVVMFYEADKDGNGYDFFVKAPDGRVSKFNLCGTCKEIDHVAGPMKEAELYYDGESAYILILFDKYVRKNK